MLRVGVWRVLVFVGCLCVCVWFFRLEMCLFRCLCMIVRCCISCCCLCVCVCSCMCFAVFTCFGCDLFGVMLYVFFVFFVCVFVCVCVSFVMRLCVLFLV